MGETVKVLVLGVLVYFSPNFFFTVGSRWFPEIERRAEYEERALALRRKYWRAVQLIITVVGGILLVQYSFGLLSKVNCQYWLRLFAIVVALAATLGRGGWGIQSYKGRTIIERIDRGMYVLSQLGATSILLFLLLL